MKVTITTIPHDKQRYDTVGDWETGPRVNEFWIKVSQMSDWRYEFLVGIHEAVEAALCHHRGITEEEVTAFDKKFDEEPPEGKWPGVEPGDSPDAPYRKEHFFATTIERLIAAELGVDWNTYDDEVESL